ncbi:MAG: DsbA family oxidoreductase [Pseudomonadota bacterium]
MTIPVDILSDPICPWCYIGKTRLERALQERPGHPLVFAWRPFQLNPDMPPEGMDRTAYLERKFGGPDGAREVYGAIERAAEADGLVVNFDRIKRTPNTLDAHRVIGWAEEEDLQGRVVDALFEKYFVEGEDLSDRDLLAGVADTAGLDAERVRSALETDVDLDKVRQQDAAARQAGISGVPTFIVNARHVVPGAQDTPLWLRVIDELSEALEAHREQQGRETAS